MPARGLSIIGLVNTQFHADFTAWIALTRAGALTPVWPDQDLAASPAHEPTTHAERTRF